MHTAAGRRHLRRVLDTLARVVPGENRDLDPDRMRFQVPAGSIVLVFSPMLSQVAVAATTMLAARGLDVVVVDCLPERRRPRRATTQRLALAWRMRLLEREALLARVAPRPASRSSPGAARARSTRCCAGCGRRGARTTAGRR